jgi:hypothetical protein
LKAGTRTEDIEQARAQLASARGSLQTIQTQINDTVLRAPFDGVITQKYADPGAFVTPTTSGSAVSSATSSSIVSLASTNQVVANIAEVNIAKIRLGQKVIITADAYPGKTFEGKVSQIAAQAIVEQNVTSFQVKVAIVSDSENLLRSGMNVTTDFEVGQLKNALVVPTAAVVRRERSTGVFVAGEDNKPVFTRIQTGATVDKYTEVKSGLKGNERVLLSFPPGSRPQSTPRGGILPGVGGGAWRWSWAVVVVVRLKNLVINITICLRFLLNRKIAVLSQLSEILSMAVETLWSNKLRTGLTMLGVIIGISSVIAITSVGQGVQKGTEQQIQALGPDVLSVFSGAARSGNIRQGIGSSSTLTWDDAKAIAQQAPSAQIVSAYLQRNAQIVYGGQNDSTPVYGTDLNYPEVRDIQIQNGRFFNQEELDTAREVAVIGPTLESTLFNDGGDPIGKRIRIQGEGL